MAVKKGGNLRKDTKNEACLTEILDQSKLFIEKLPDQDIRRLTNSLKSFYDELKAAESKKTIPGPSSFNSSSTLPVLIVENLDEEQIWQQLELQNGEKLRNFRQKLEILDENDVMFDRIFDILSKNLSTNSQNAQKADSNLNPDTFFNQEDSHEENLHKSKQLRDSEDSEDDDEDNVDDDIVDDGDNLVDAAKSSERKIKDKFFDMKEMEAFLEEQDRREMEKMSGRKVEDQDEDDEDAAEIADEMLELDDDDENDIDDSQNYRYKDFFGSNRQKNEVEKSTKKKKVTFNIDNNGENEPENEEDEMNEDDEEELLDDDESELEQKSSFESRQEKLEERIKEIEQKNLAEKSWQLTGEVTARSRPENSLLEEYVEFEHTVRLPPIVTQETTQKLEDIVKQRIKDKAWDDVERKVKPTNEPYKYKNELILDQQKSKISLSQIYEQEYLKQNQKETEEACNEQHEEIRKQMKALFAKLDALTNYHYTPKPPNRDIKIINNTKSITVEEVAPVTVGNADLLAPEEIKAKPRGDLKSAEERTKSDKLRELRRKKKMAKLKVKRREEKEGKSTKVPKDKMKMLQKLGKVHKIKGNTDDKKRKSQSSAEFFSALQAKQSILVAADKSSNKRKKFA